VNGWVGGWGGHWEGAPVNFYFFKTIIEFAINVVEGKEKLRESREGDNGEGYIQNLVRKDSDCVFRWCRQYLLQRELLPI